MKYTGKGIISATVLTVMIGLFGCDGGGGGATDSITAVRFTTGQSAAVVIGQADFGSSDENQGGDAAANTLSGPYGNPYVSAGTMYLPEHTNNRVLVYNRIPTANNATADFAIGQPDLLPAVSGTSATIVGGPQQTVIHQGKMLVAEYSNNRISIYNTVPASSPGTIGVVVGQADKISKVTDCSATRLYEPETAVMAGDKLVVTDSGHNRVLIWNSLPTTDNQAADLVLGQGDFISCEENRGGAVAANTFDYPAGVWSDGKRLVVADSGNNRVLIWNSIPVAHGQAADLVLGQVDFVSNFANGINGTPSPSTMETPYAGVYFNSAQLFIADANNNRVLVWNSFPTTNGQAANTVLGQPDFVSNGCTTSETGMCRPTGIFLYGKQLLVGEEANNRYLIFNGM